MFRLYQIFQRITSLFSEDDLSKLVGKSMFYTLIIKVLNVLVTFSLVPISLKLLSNEEYGLWLTISSVFGWVTFLDIGIGNGLRNTLTRAHIKGRDGLVRDLLGSAYSIFSMLGICFTLVFFFSLLFIDWNSFFNTEADTTTLYNTIVVLFISTILLFVLKLINVLFLSLHLSFLIELLSAIGNFLTLIVFVIFFTLDRRLNLFHLSLVYSIAPVVVYLIVSVYYYGISRKEFRPRIVFFKFLYFREIFGDGFKFFLLQITSLIIFTTSNIIIAKVLSPADVTAYNVTWKLYNLFTVLFGVFITPYWSAITESFHKGNFVWIENAVKKAIYFWAFLSVGILIFAIFSKYVFNLWLGDTVQVTFALSISSGIFVIVGNWNTIFAYFLAGVGVLRLQTIAAVLGAVCHIPLTIFLVNYFGVEGVALGMSLTLFLSSSLLTFIQYKKIIRRKADGIWK